MARADFLFGAFLTLLGSVVAVESWRMPRLAHLDINPYTVPGLVPGLLGIVIAVLGLVLTLRAAARLTAAPAEAAGPNPNSTRRLVLALVLTLGYALGLVGRLPFWLATFLFVTLFIAAFAWRQTEAGRPRLVLLATAALQGALVSAAVTLLFQEVFLVRLP